MILKLRMQGGKNGIGWRMIDEIERVDYQIIDEPRDIDLLRSREWCKKKKE